MEMSSDDKAAFDTREQLKNNWTEVQAFYTAACNILQRGGDKDELLGALELFDHALEYFHSGRVIQDDDFYLNVNYMKS